ncbi:hypothetical protein D3C72_2438940 [compost metagenome]
MAEKVQNVGNMVLAASLMEQAAKEVGDSYTNRREVTNKFEGMTDESVDNSPR